MKFNLEERIQQIKDCGQSVIDNAESIYGAYKYPQGVKITINLPCDAMPGITVEKEFTPEGIVERMCVRDLP